MRHFVVKMITYKQPRATAINMTSQTYTPVLELPALTIFNLGVVLLEYAIDTNTTSIKSPISCQSHKFIYMYSQYPAISAAFARFVD